MGDIPCKHCGSYYSHKPKCIYWMQTGLHDHILILEIKERVDRECYDLENKINSLQKQLDRCERNSDFLLAQNKELEKVATEWMNDYDKLKDKYEPTTLVLSEELKEGE